MVGDSSLKWIDIGVDDGVGVVDMLLGCSLLGSRIGICVHNVIRFLANSPWVTSLMASWVDGLGYAYS